MKFSHDLTYDATPDAVLAMLADPAFRDQVCEAVHGRDRTVQIQGVGAGMTVRVDQTLPAHGVPSFATRFVGDAIQIVRHESWTTDRDAGLELELPGKPGSFAGTIALAAAGPGSTETIRGEIKVKVPLIGGKLEALVADLLRSALQAENRVGKDWLAGR